MLPESFPISNWAFDKIASNSDSEVSPQKFEIYSSPLEISSPYSKSSLVPVTMIDVLKKSFNFKAKDLKYLMGHCLAGPKIAPGLNTKKDFGSWYLNEFKLVSTHCFEITKLGG